MEASKKWDIPTLTNYLSGTLSGYEETPPGYELYRGKVRDSFASSSKRILIASDRLSCFDKVVTTVPFKGQVLTQLALYWFEQTKDIISNHILEVLTPEALLVREAKVVPVEVVVRAYVTGSAWRDYQAGRAVSGIELPAGLVEYQKLPHLLLTPSTKAEQGLHDEPISEAEIIRRNIVSQSLWNEIREKAFALYERASEQVAERGLLLVDTKFEFGVLDGKLILVDEIFTLDSSRYWEKATYAPGHRPAMLDKEPVRQWLLQQGWQGDGPSPAFSDSYRAELALHYIHSYERITGKSFVADTTPVAARLKAAMARIS